MMALLVGLGPDPAQGQAASTPAAPGSPAAEETITLSPFEVSTEKDTGYTATSTLAGSRLNTSLRDTPAAISVFTREFLDDIGALNVGDALEFGLNAEKDHTDLTGNVLRSNDLSISIRGFVGASLGRNFFSNRSISTDSFNIERLDFSRGPNSVLYGQGAPGGMINISTKRAKIGQNTQSLQLRAGSWRDQRTALDVNRRLGRSVAVRFNLFQQDRETWRDFEFFERRGFAGAATFRPFHHTEIRLDAERGTGRQNLAPFQPASDNLSNWVNAGSPISRTFGAAVTGTGTNSSRALVYDPLSGLGPISYFGSRNTNAPASSPALGNIPREFRDERLIPFRANLGGPGYLNEFDFTFLSAYLEQRLAPGLMLEAALNRNTEGRTDYRTIVFNAFALRGDPNAFLPDGRPNPFVGKHYVEGGMRISSRDGTADSARVTLSYDLDLRRRASWLGFHRFAALAQHNSSSSTNDETNEVNLTPAGNATYPLDLTNGNNAINRRAYLDFESDNPLQRGVSDPRRHPIVAQNGVTSGFARTRDQARASEGRSDVRMLAGQSAFLHERLFVTWGLRQDRSRNRASTADLNGNGDVNDDRDPVTRVFPVQRLVDTWTSNEGNTRTYGVVAHATGWLSAFYNNSNSFQPQSDRDINDNPLGNRQGIGQDYGVKFRLWHERIHLTVARFTTDDADRSTGIDNAFQNNLNAIWTAQGKVERNLPNGFRDTTDTASKGWEADLTANLTRHWRASLNASETDQRQTNLIPRNIAYVERHRAELLANPDLALISPPGSGVGATAAAAMRNVDGIVTGIKQGEGQIRRQLRKHQVNFFTRYSFPGAGWLRGVSLGGGAQYRSRPVTGYDTTNNGAPVYGAAYVLCNVMAGYERRLGQGRRLSFQLNIDNVLNHDELITLDKDNTGSYVFRFQNPRRWGLTSTLAF